MNVDDLPLHTQIVEGHDNALVGYFYRETANLARPVAVYSACQIVQNLINQGMPDQDAWDYFDYNIEGTYPGSGAPLFITTEG